MDSLQNFIKFASLEYAELVANVKESIKQLEAQLGKRNSFWRR